VAGSDKSAADTVIDAAGMTLLRLIDSHTHPSIGEYSRRRMSSSGSTLSAWDHVHDLAGNCMCRSPA
jgi:imidazolonepropionase-like amidohydrolase